MQGCSSSILDGSSWVAQVLIHNSQERHLVSSAQRDLTEGNALHQPAISMPFLSVLYIYYLSR